MKLVLCSSPGEKDLLAKCFTPDKMSGSLPATLFGSSVATTMKSSERGCDFTEPWHQRGKAQRQSIRQARSGGVFFELL